MKVRKLKELLSILLAASIVLFIACILGEITIRTYTKFNIIYDMEMSRYSRTLKAVSPNPRIGHIHHPNRKANLMGVDVEINSDGLRDRNYPVEKKEAYRIIFLGDSLTFGWGVDKKHTFEHLIEKSLNATRPVEILNFGAGNYNTDQEVNLFLEKGLKYKPDMVALFYFINDAEPTPQKSRWGFLEQSELITFYWSRFNMLTNRITHTKSFREYYVGLYEEDQPGWKQTQNAFKILKESCAENTIQLGVVILPELHILQNYPFKKVHEKLTNYLHEINLPHLDLLPFFQDISDPEALWVAPDDAHPNEKGHALIAKFSLDFIKSFKE